jgi:hypothetical protein
LDNFAKRCIFLGEVAKVGGECLVQFPKLLEDMVGIIKIAKGIEINGPERKSGRASPQRAGAEICTEGKRPNNLGHHTNTKDKPGYNFQQEWYPKGKTTNVGNKESGFVVLKQIRNQVGRDLASSSCDRGVA